MQHLLTLLGMEYVLSIKLRNYHWNITGMSFLPIHKLLGQHYNKLSDCIDKIAEHIRTHNIAAPGSSSELLRLNSMASSPIEEAPGKLINVESAIQDLMYNHINIRSHINSFDKNNMDLAAQDLLSKLDKFHAKSIWILRAHIERVPNNSSAASPRTAALSSAVYPLPYMT